MIFYKWALSKIFRSIYIMHTEIPELAIVALIDVYGSGTSTLTGSDGSFIFVSYCDTVDFRTPIASANFSCDIFLFFLNNLSLSPIIII